MMPVTQVPIELADWASVLQSRTKRNGWRYGHLTLRRGRSEQRILEALLLDTNTGGVEIVSAPIPQGSSEFPSITGPIPAAHWAERLVGDLWGVRATGHLRWKSLILHEAWPSDEFPFALPSDAPPSQRDVHFMTVAGEGVHEIAVGPIHAGIIEPGHFRFSCIGEVVANLEVRLGYQHRGIEQGLTACPWQHARYLAESASSDSAVANALAHSEALERLLGVDVPRRAAAIRTMALEIERIATHLGDLGGLAADIGFAIGAAAFGRLRGAALGLGQTLSGSRFQRGFVCPGGLAWDVSDRQLSDLAKSLNELRRPIIESRELLLGNPGVQERLQGVGVLQPSLADEFGMVGPTARASGSQYDARNHFPHALYPEMQISLPNQPAGDALARAQVRQDEVFASLDVIQSVLETIQPGPFRLDLPTALPALGVGIGVVEAWRGELIHWITTNDQGAIDRYAIRDPSFQNWTGVAISARRNLVADFPLINKSFSLSYSGNDL